MPVLIGCDNRITTAVLTSASEVPSLPVTNLQNQHGDSAHAFQSNPLNNNFSIRIDSGDEASTWQVVSLHWTNLSDTSTWRVQVGSQAWLDGTGGPAYDSGTMPVAIPRGYSQVVHLMPAVQTGRICRIVLTDTSNPDGYITVAQAYAGPVRSFKGISPQSTWEVDAERFETVTRGGQQYINPRYERRAWTVQFPATPTAQIYDDVAELMRVARTGQNVLFIPFSTGDIQRDTVFGTFLPSNGVGYTNQSGLYRTWAGRFAERL